MLQLRQTIPDPEALLALEPEELAAKLLFLIRGRSDLGARYHPGNLELKDVRQGEKLVKREGNITKRIIVDPDELAAWCAMRGREPIASARAEYICEKMTQAVIPTDRR